MYSIVFDCDGTILNPDDQHRPYSGIKKLLQNLFEHGYEIYLWTGRDRASCIKYLTQYGLIIYFDELCCVDDDVSPKPHIAGLKKIVGHQEKKNILVVGDSPLDTMGARNFGVKSIGAGWNATVVERNLLEMGAEKVVATPEDCITLIPQILGDTDV